jgi:hypothetical protein
MPAPDASATDGRSGVWGIVQIGPSGPPVTDAAVSALDGMVVVGVGVAGMTGASVLAVPMPPDASAAACLATGIRALPEAAGVIAWFADRVPDADDVAAAVRLASRLDRCDAVVTAVPVSEAVKEVADGLIVRTVPREGLCVPGPPLVVRAAVARAALLEQLDRGHEPVAALGLAGVPVGTVPARPG